MSAWRIGSPSSGYLDGGNGFKDSIDKLTRWIPGDVLALYVAAITALKGVSATSVPSVPLLVVFAILTPAVIGLAAWKSEPTVTKVPIKIGLGIVAFLVWSLSIPFSGWQRWSLVSKNPAAIAIGAAIVGLFYGLVADKLVDE